MNTTHINQQVYVKKPNRYSRMSMVQISIILAFIFISTLISILLPIYFAYLPLAGG
jgi:hypothetical protein